MHFASNLESFIIVLGTGGCLVRVCRSSCNQEIEGYQPFGAAYNLDNLLLRNTDRPSIQMQKRLAHCQLERACARRSGLPVPEIFLRLGACVQLVIPSRSVVAGHRRVSQKLTDGTDMMLF